MHQADQLPLRDADEVMAPEHLGAVQPGPLSCTRYFISALFDRPWSIERRVFELDEVGAGIARYDIRVDGRLFEFVALANAPVPEGRSGRVLTGDRDMNAGLHEGRASDEQIAVMRREMPLIYRGRCAPGTLIWCRANRSTRIFDHVVDSLAEGHQPDPDRLARIPYVMRNVGIEGNGIYGTRSFLTYGDDHPLRAPYAAQMLAAFMMREFAVDLVEHLARVRSANAVPLAPDFRRFIGIGNGSAIGLVFFIQNRPRFVGQWLALRERLLAAARALDLAADAPETALFTRLLDSAITYRRQDRVTPADARVPSGAVADDLAALRSHVDQLLRISGGLDVGRLLDFAHARLGRTAYETANSIAMELLPRLRDLLLTEFIVDEELHVRPAMTLGELRGLIDAQYRWALDLDLTTADSRHYVWYQSVSNDEPRRGPRDEIDAGCNMLWDIPGETQRLARDVDQRDPDETVAAFLRHHPDHRHMIERVQGLADMRYHTPQANPFARDFVAVDLVRLIMVGYYGLEKPIDFFDRNSRGVMFHGAPTRADLGGPMDPAWFYPPLPGSQI